ncbi:MAG: hypothetical protein ACTSVB_03090 [Candidatus Heimdallarchaeaceae archaeon]
MKKEGITEEQKQTYKVRTRREKQRYKNLTEGLLIGVEVLILLRRR